MKSLTMGVGDTGQPGNEQTVSKGSGRYPKKGGK
jgi:hypothetical protein